MAALRLTSAHGLDGFTMDDLAEAAEVSRRTLFNYFPSKLDAVLGPAHEFDEQDFAEFVAGGPTGGLVDDTIVLIRLMTEVKDVTREEVALAWRVLKSEPRLLVAAHQRFERVSEEFVRLILQREGAAFGEHRARLFVRAVVTGYDVALDALVEEPGTERRLDGFADSVEHNIRVLQEVLRR